MNYSAYIGVASGSFERDDVYEAKNPGLGYVYSSDEVFNAVPSPGPEKYGSFKETYASIPDGNERLNVAMTEMAHFITNKV